MGKKRQAKSAASKKVAPAPNNNSASDSVEQNQPAGVPSAGVPVVQEEQTPTRSDSAATESTDLGVRDASRNTIESVEVTSPDEVKPQKQHDDGDAVVVSASAEQGGASAMEAGGDCSSESLRSAEPEAAESHVETGTGAEDKSGTHVTSGVGVEHGAESSEARVAELLGELEAVKKRGREYAEESAASLAQLEDKVSRREEALCASEEKVKALQENLHAALSERAKAEQQVDLLVGEVSRANAKIVELEGEVEKRDSVRENNSQELKHAESRIKELIAQLDELEDAKDNAARVAAAAGVEREEALEKEQQHQRKIAEFEKVVGELEEVLKEKEAAAVEMKVEIDAAGKLREQSDAAAEQQKKTGPLAQSMSQDEAKELQMNVANLYENISELVGEIQRLNEALGISESELLAANERYRELVERDAESDAANAAVNLSAEQLAPVDIIALIHTTAQRIQNAFERAQVSDCLRTASKWLLPPQLPTAL